ncbi:hypothetical protein [Brevibacterium linens]|uniref:Uncharacterized protein n=2 Tax=Brevibacterium linens TaxID=1703 RepID=A0A2H1J9M4_BRELN|nr:hypothetical protein [Brevibacterium linens]KAB1948891.1 hypothetical protein F8227_05125 [Brevibacterium linens ATCC 9172]SMX77622.1 hypothetical protein BLIN9172_01350 [Brevibacterium linens ATCC 9172]SMX83852.1 hypothetical protein BLIN101_02058 [Brevibacterium linens]
MVRIVRRNNRPPLMTCLIVVFSFVALGILTVAGILVAVIFLSSESSSTGSSPTSDSSSIGSSSSDSDSDGGPGPSTTAPVSGGWSSGG